jgi:tRNA-2-methylthio-N6-dimethylallyladenosine synthase
MNRPYTKEQYLGLVKKIKEEIPGIIITTDVIVGFPGETEKDFKETLELLKEVNYNWVFVNKYSPRSGTVAFKLGDPIPWSEKQRRWRILDELTNKKTTSY